MSPANFLAMCVQTDCVIFTGAQTKNGYGSVRHPETGEVTYAHRLAWELENGPIPDGFDIDHTCRVHPCVRLSHLVLIDHAEHAAKDSLRRHALARTG